MPETGDAVLITRPEPGASETASRIRVLGLRPIVSPLLEIRIRRLNLPPPARLQAILATSGNAIPPLPPSHRHLPFFAVGHATATRASEAGFDNVSSADGDAEALAALVRQSCEPHRAALLLATGQGQGTALTAALRTSGFGVIRRVAYAAVPARGLPEPAQHALAAGSLRAALFFSAETARICVRLLRATHLDQLVGMVDALAIGDTTAVALQALPWRRIRVAARPNQDAMLALLQ